MTQRLAVYLDYQNVHLTGHTLFAEYGAPVHQSLVHPLRLAERIAGKRRDPSQLTSVRVFRGRPNPEHHPELTAGPGTGLRSGATAGDREADQA